MKYSSAAALGRKTGHSICDSQCLTDANLSKELRLDSRIHRPNAEFLESLRWKIMLRKKAVAQIARSIDVGRVIDMAVGIQVRPPDLIRSGIFFHARKIEDV